MVVGLICIAVFRLTWLITKDEFPPAAAFRKAVEDRFGENSSWTYLATCPWCVSMYVGAAVVAGTVAAGVHVPAPVLVWFVTSAVTGILAVLVTAVVTVTKGIVTMVRDIADPDFDP